MSDRELYLKLEELAREAQGNGAKAVLYCAAGAIAIGAADAMAVYLLPFMEAARRMAKQADTSDTVVM